VLKKLVARIIIASEYFPNYLLSRYPGLEFLLFPAIILSFSVVTYCEVSNVCAVIFQLHLCLKMIKYASKVLFKQSIFAFATRTRVSALDCED